MESETRVTFGQVIVGAEDNESRRSGGVDVGRRSHEPVSIGELPGTAAHVVRVELARHV
jgi:hypothetical protein